MRRAAVVDAETLPLEAWEDKSKGAVQWKTLISSDRTDSDSLVCGLAYFGPGESLAEHRHVQAEMVHVVKGSGFAKLDDEEVALASGSTVFVPSNLKHGFVAGAGGLTLLYAFAVSSFDEVKYRFALD